MRVKWFKNLQINFNLKYPASRKKEGKRQEEILKEVKQTFSEVHEFLSKTDTEADASLRPEVKTA